ncbi:hypothetical protein D3C72_2372300 [compost metagenome]
MPREAPVTRATRVGSEAEVAVVFMARFLGGGEWMKRMVGHSTQKIISINSSIKFHLLKQ